MQNMPDHLPQLEVTPLGYVATGAPDSEANPQPRGGNRFGCSRPLFIVLLVVILMCCCCCGAMAAAGAFTDEDDAESSNLPGRDQNTSAFYLELDPIVQWMPVVRGDFVLILPEG